MLSKRSQLTNVKNVEKVSQTKVAWRHTWCIIVTWDLFLAQYATKLSKQSEISSPYMNWVTVQWGEQFNCTSCEATFAQSSSLYIHTKSLNKVKIKECLGKNSIQDLILSVTDTGKLNFCFIIRRKKTFSSIWWDWLIVLAIDMFDHPAALYIMYNIQVQWAHWWAKNDQ